MTIDPAILFGIGLVYLGILAALAWFADSGRISERIATHPAVYALSLSVIACGWAFFGSLSVAANYHYSFMALFVGTGALFLFAPLLLLPLMHICHQHQLTSLPDLLAFRYRSPGTGAIVTIAQLLACFPLLTLQIRLFTETVSVLGGIDASSDNSSLLGFAFCLGITAFALIFGVRSITQDERHNGLVISMALESLVKIIAFGAIGLIIATRIFESPDSISIWLMASPDLLEGMANSLNSPTSYVLTLLFMVSSLALPQLFFMGIYESPRARAVRHSFWGMPVLMLAIALPVLPIVWAGHRLDLSSEAALFLPQLAVVLGVPTMLLTFIVTVSATSSSSIIIVLALARSISNNLLLPLLTRDGEIITRRTRLNRSIVIALIMFSTLLFARRIAETDSLMHIGFTAFIGLAQFIPGIAALLYWPRANRWGLYIGLLAGFVFWVALVLDHGNATWLASSPLTTLVADNLWASVALSSLAINAFLLVVVSLLTPRTKDERDAAIICSIDTFSGHSRQELTVRSAGDFPTALARSLGQQRATRVVERALSDLGLDLDETRSTALFALRQRVEAQLARLLGAQLAMEIVQRELPSRANGETQQEDIYQLELRADNLGGNLTGLAADLDGLRRFYRETLQDLPVGICGINAENEVVMWNRTLSQLTDIPITRVLGSGLDLLPQPWSRLLQRFIASGETHRHAVRISVNKQTRWITMHRTDPLNNDLDTRDTRFVVLEDVTETQLLQDELVHSGRLASIGRLAAGVAHEIGNPVTAIDCLAQNLVAESSDNAVRDEARAIIGQTHRISEIVQTLVNFAHSGANQRGVVEQVMIHPLVDEAIYFLALGRDTKQIKIVNYCDPVLQIETEPQRLMQVLINLLSNACDASDEGQEVHVETRIQRAGIEIHVRDNGCGIPASELENIYEPFYTTKAPGKGTGLGLSLVYSIVRDIGGEITAESPTDRASGRGTDMCVRLPFTSMTEAF